MHQIKFLLIAFVLLSLLGNSAYAKSSSKPALMLANVYHAGIDLDQYWVSEKFDGVRALWDGEKFVSRGGNIYHAPKWFIQDFPKLRLDGELWIGRQQFELLLSTVRDDMPDSTAWQKVKYMVFDMPDLSSSFDQRIPQIKKVVNEAGIDWLLAVRQWKVSNHQALMKELAEITAVGAEGLMLHKGSSFYRSKRSADLLKVKAYEDAEALVIGHLQGKGKYKNKLGSLLVETLATTSSGEKVRFKLGSGFSDYERSNPPRIGDIVTFQYRGKTSRGVPRFASFLRVRKLKE